MLQSIKGKILLGLALISYVFVFSNIFVGTPVYAASGTINISCAQINAAYKNAKFDGPLYSTTINGEKINYVNNRNGHPSGSYLKLGSIDGNVNTSTKNSFLSPKFICVFGNNGSGNTLTVSSSATIYLYPTYGSYNNNYNFYAIYPKNNVCSAIANAIKNNKKTVDNNIHITNNAFNLPANANKIGQIIYKNGSVVGGCPIAQSDVNNSALQIYITPVNQTEPGNTYGVYSSSLIIPPPPSHGGAYSAQKACVGSGIGVGASRNCQTCVRKGINSGYNYVYTDFGCINTSISGVINFVYRLFLVIAFMIALAVIIFAGYLIMVSGGDPDQLNRGKSLLTKAIIGLLVIVFAYVMLTTIGTIFGIKFLA